MINIFGIINRSTNAKFIDSKSYNEKIIIQIFKYLIYFNKKYLSIRSTLTIINIAIIIISFKFDINKYNIKILIMYIFK